MLGSQPDVEVDTQRFGHFLCEKLAQASTDDPANDHADENRLGERAVSGDGPRLPRNGMRSQPCRRRRPVVEIVDRPVPVGRPAVCENRWRTSIFSLPGAANTVQYRITGAAGSSSPWPARISAHSAVSALVTEKTLVIVARHMESCGRRRRSRGGPAWPGASTVSPAVTGSGSTPAPPRCTWPDGLRTTRYQRLLPDDGTGACGQGHAARVAGADIRPISRP